MNRPNPVHKYLTIMVLIACALPVFAGGAREAGDRISPEDASRLFQSGDAVLVDVRDENSYVETHISGAIHISLGEISRRTAELSADGRTIIAYCNCPAEETSLAAASDLIAAGVTDVYVLDGGIAAWAEAGLPLKRGPRP
jgi:hydroxyacylglutathione hydrolase